MSLDSINSDLNALFLVCAMLCIVLVSVVYFFTAFCQGKIRSRVFNAEFMSQFDTEHQEAFGKPAPVGGYPDCGNGFYSEKLSYKDWYDLNNWQRAQMNILETIIPFSVMVGITAINQPMMAAICSLVFLLGRIMYACGYCRGGPKGRIPGAVLSDLAILGALGGAFWSIFTWQESETVDEMNFKILPISQ